MDTLQQYYENVKALKDGNIDTTDLTINTELNGGLDRKTAGILKTVIAEDIQVYKKQLKDVYMNEYTSEELNNIDKELDRLYHESQAGIMYLNNGVLPAPMYQEFKESIQQVLIRRTAELWFDISRGN